MSVCSLRGAMRWARTPATTLSRIDMGKGLGRWKTMPTRRRSTRRSMSRPEISTPSSSMVPVRQ